MGVAKALLIFIIAGICEIGGGYMIWLWLKKDKPIWYCVFGAFILIGYAVVATMQTMEFAKAYATYGGIFIVMSFLWAYKFDGYVPDRWDIIGSLVALLGVCIICFMPRN